MSYHFWLLQPTLLQSEKMIVNQKLKLNVHQMYATHHVLQNNANQLHQFANQNHAILLATQKNAIQQLQPLQLQPLQQYHIMLLQVQLYIQQRSM